MPYSFRILLENAVRGGREADAAAILGWPENIGGSAERHFAPRRLLMHDTTALVDLAAMRAQLAAAGGNSIRIDSVARLPSRSTIRWRLITTAAPMPRYGPGRNRYGGRPAPVAAGRVRMRRRRDPGRRAIRAGLVALRLLRGGGMIPHMLSPLLGGATVRQPRGVLR